MPLVLNTMLVSPSKNVYLQLKTFSRALDLLIQLSTWIFKVDWFLHFETEILVFTISHSNQNIHHLRWFNSIFLAFQVKAHSSLIYQKIKRILFLNEFKISWRTGKGLLSTHMKVSILALPPLSCVTSGRLLRNLSLGFLNCKTWVIIIPSLQNWWEI